MASATIPAPRRRGRSKWGDSLYAYGFIAPAIIAMVIASFIPIVFTIVVAFTNYDEFNNIAVSGFHFVGFYQFHRILDDLQGEIVPVVIWTIAFATISTLINFFLGLFLAFLLNNPHMWERNLYRTVLILPWAVPGAIMTLAWYGLLQQIGPIDTVLTDNLHLSAIPWLDDPNWARFSVIMVNAWFGFPFMMTACLGALQSIPPELGEAAEVDGAGVLTRFWRITFPLLRSATLPLILSTFAYNLNNFGAVYLLTQGGPSTLQFHGATDILPTYVYKEAFNNHAYALACAYAIFIFIFIGGLSLIQMKYTRAFEGVD